MFFTQDDYKKIEDYLRTRTIKDTEFPIADAIKENDLITIVQDGKNKTVQFSSLVLDVLNRYCPNVYNIHRRESITIKEAISLVPEECRKLGLIITFYSANDSDYYEIWQFVGSTPMDVLNHWGEYDDEHYWINRYKDVYRTISAIYSRIDGIENHVTNIGRGLAEHENNTNQKFGRINAFMQSLNNSIMNTDSKIETLGNSKGNPNGIAPLDSTGLIPSVHLPSYVDDVLEYESRAGFPSVGEGGKLYIERSGGKVYRWAGTQYIEITNDLHLGEGSWEAFPGNRGVALEEKSEELQTRVTNAEHHIARHEHDLNELSEHIDRVNSLIGITIINQ